MNSPITGKKMSLTQERRLMEFRKESFEIVFHFYKCEESGEQFTTTALDEVNMNQVYNQYRDKFNIPFPDEIGKIREKYGLSAAKMSEVLGFGANSYRQYESGEMPSTANAKLIQMAEDPKKFGDMVELCGTLDDKTKIKYLQKSQSLIEVEERNRFASNFKSYMLGAHLADVYSGYRNPNFEKFTEMVVYFSEKLAPFKTKMNKLLFYSDFLMFKNTCFSMSGMRYKALELGPVPYNFQSIFEYLSKHNDIEIVYNRFPQGYVGEEFCANKERPFNPDLFTSDELAVLDKVAEAFKTTSTNDIIELSHLENAWKKNEKERDFISYEYAFELTQL